MLISRLNWVTQYSDHDLLQALKLTANKNILEIAQYFITHYKYINDIDSV